MGKPSMCELTAADESENRQGHARLLIRPCEVCRVTSILHLVGASPAGDQTLVEHRLCAWLASSHKILPTGNTRLRLHRAESTEA